MSLIGSVRTIHIETFNGSRTVSTGSSQETGWKFQRNSFTSGATDTDSALGEAMNKGTGKGKDKGKEQGKVKEREMAKVKVSTQGSSPIPASPMNPVAGATEEYATPTREMESATMKNCPHAHLSQ